MTKTLPDRRGGQRSVLDRALSDTERNDLEHLLDHAGSLLLDTVPSLTEIDDFAAANAALSATRTSVLKALQGDSDALHQVVETPSMFDLIGQMGNAEQMVRDAETRSRNSAVRIAWETLAELQDVLSVPHLIKLGTEAVCRLGFDRAIVSQVNESTWMTESIYVDGDSEWADEILAAGKQQPQMLAPGLPELDIVRRRRPIVVTHVQERTQVHKPVADASRSRSYAAAPIMPRAKVIGFLHVDRYFHRGEVTQFDCDLLGLFAQGFGFALERAMMATEMEAMRAQIRALATDLTSIAADPQGFGLDLQPRPADTAPQAWHAMTPVRVPTQSPTFDGTDDRLTRREQEVLKLMAEGETNQRIASRLIISEGTVKSHVKHILRKLRAANRAEAVARWHGAQPR
ncbi:LuxR C-terminal-related transcriptional regulator [Nocardioides dubius]|uniref:HTH luxR-type domain-containing protein n=1 Tax=Nocardioides dubius TaxID=317019 RepID=A0ABN1U1D4_9ACTN